MNHLDVKKKNRYPKLSYEEALNFDLRFAEHLAQKKENHEKHGQDDQMGENKSSI